jgi:hypothetical protein
VGRTAPASGTARSLIQTSAEALRFPAGSPMPRCSGPRFLRRPAAAMSTAGGATRPSSMLLSANWQADG